MLIRGRLVVVCALLIAATLALAACGDDDAEDTSAGASGDDVEGVTWQLTELEGEPLPDGAVVTLEYDGDAVSGSGGCNRYSGDATFEDGTAEVSSELATTLMACEEPIGAVESAYLQALPSATEFDLDGDTLTLSADGEAILIYTAS